MTQQASYSLALAALGLILFTLKKLQKKHISEAASINWIVFGLAITVFAIFPQSIDFLTQLTGAKYAPIAFVCAIVAFLVMQQIHSSVKLKKLQLQNIKLVQKLALLEIQFKEEIRETNTPINSNQ